MFHMLNGVLDGREGFGQAIDLLSRSPMFKGVLVAMLILAYWHKHDDQSVERRNGLLAIVITSMVAIVVGRAMALLLPFRDRPIHTEGLDLVLAQGFSENVLRGWSSFPSDNSIFFFSLAFAFFVVSARAATVLLIHAAIVVALPRIILGLHWPSDIIAGVFVGGAVAWIVAPRLKRFFSRLGLATWMENHAVIGYPILFFLLFQLSTNFGSARAWASLMFDLISLSL